MVQKSTKYTDVQEQYASGEIDDEELEREIDRLMQEDGGIDTSEPPTWKFHAQQAAEIILFILGVIAVSALLLYTKGAALVLLIPLSVAIAVYAITTA